MTDTGLQRTTIEHELRQVLAALELVSHVPALDYASKRDNKGSVTDDRSPGGKRPRGGVDRQDDREREYTLKSADHFRRRLAHATSRHTLELILKEARASLDAHRKVPDWKKGEIEPERKTLRWKRMIANSPATAEVLAKRHEIGVRTVKRYREMYRQRDAA